MPSSSAHTVECVLGSRAPALSCCAPPLALVPESSGMGRGGEVGLWRRPQAFAVERCIRQNAGLRLETGEHRLLACALLLRQHDLGGGVIALGDEATPLDQPSRPIVSGKFEPLGPYR